MIINCAQVIKYVDVHQSTRGVTVCVLIGCTQIEGLRTIVG